VQDDHVDDFDWQRHIESLPKEEVENYSLVVTAEPHLAGFTRLAAVWTRSEDGEEVRSEHVAQMAVSARARRAAADFRYPLQLTPAERQRLLPIIVARSFSTAADLVGAFDMLLPFLHTHFELGTRAADYAVADKTGSDDRMRANVPEGATVLRALVLVPSKPPGQYPECLRVRVLRLCTGELTLQSSRRPSGYTRVKGSTLDVAMDIVNKFILAALSSRTHRAAPADSDGPREDAAPDARGIKRTADGEALPRH
jgi:hypothetical protein